MFTSYIHVLHVPYPRIHMHHLKLSLLFYTSHYAWWHSFTIQPLPSYLDSDGAGVGAGGSEKKFAFFCMLGLKHIIRFAVWSTLSSKYLIYQVCKFAICTFPLLFYSPSKRIYPQLSKPSSPAPSELHTVVIFPLFLSYCYNIYVVRLEPVAW